jgi:hypothetical protein
MNQLSIHIDGDRDRFAPGETVTGRVAWTVAEPPKRAELCLCWSARLPRDERSDAVAATVAFEVPRMTDERDFEIALPLAPVSCRGEVIELTWTLEMTIEPGAHVAQAPLVVAPGEEALRLEKVGEQSKLAEKKLKKFGLRFGKQ